MSNNMFDFDQNRLNVNDYIQLINENDIVFSKEPQEPKNFTRNKLAKSYGVDIDDLKGMVFKLVSKDKIQRINPDDESNFVNSIQITISSQETKNSFIKYDFKKRIKMYKTSEQIIEEYGKYETSTLDLLKKKNTNKVVIGQDCIDNDILSGDTVVLNSSSREMLNYLKDDFLDNKILRQYPNELSSTDVLYSNKYMVFKWPNNNNSIAIYKVKDSKPVIPLLLSNWNGIVQYDLSNYFIKYDVDKDKVTEKADVRVKQSRSQYAEQLGIVDNNLNQIPGGKSRLYFCKKPEKGPNGMAMKGTFDEALKSENAGKGYKIEINILIDFIDDLFLYDNSNKIISVERPSNEDIFKYFSVEDPKIKLKDLPEYTEKDEDATEISESKGSEYFQHPSWAYEGINLIMEGNENKNILELDLPSGITAEDWTGVILKLKKGIQRFKITGNIVIPKKANIRIKTFTDDKDKTKEINVIPDENDFDDSGTISLKGMRTEWDGEKNIFIKETEPAKSLEKRKSDVNICTIEINMDDDTDMDVSNFTITLSDPTKGTKFIKMTSDNMYYEDALILVTFTGINEIDIKRETDTKDTTVTEETTSVGTDLTKYVPKVDKKLDSEEDSEIESGEDSEEETEEDSEEDSEELKSKILPQPPLNWERTNILDYNTYNPSLWNGILIDLEDNIESFSVFGTPLTERSNIRLVKYTGSEVTATPNQFHQYNDGALSLRGIVANWDGNKINFKKETKSAKTLKWINTNVKLCNIRLQKISENQIKLRLTDGIKNEEFFEKMITEFNFESLKKTIMISFKDIENLSITKNISKKIVKFTKWDSKVKVKLIGYKLNNDTSNKNSLYINPILKQFWNGILMKTFIDVTLEIYGTVTNDKTANIRIGKYTKRSKLVPNSLDSLLDNSVSIKGMITVWDNDAKKLIFEKIAEPITTLTKKSDNNFICKVLIQPRGQILHVTIFNEDKSKYLETTLKYKSDQPVILFSIKEIENISFKKI